MNKNRVRKIAWILAAALMVTAVPVNHLYAAEPVIAEPDINKMFQYLYIDQPEQQ